MSRVHMNDSLAEIAENAENTREGQILFTLFSVFSAFSADSARFKRRAFDDTNTMKPREAAGNTLKESLQ